MCAAQFRAPHFWSDNSPQFLMAQSRRDSAMDTGPEQVVLFLLQFSMPGWSYLARPSWVGSPAQIPITEGAFRPVREGI